MSVVAIPFRWPAERTIANWQEVGRRTGQWPQAGGCWLTVHIFQLVPFLHNPSILAHGTICSVSTINYTFQKQLANGRRLCQILFHRHPPPFALPPLLPAPLLYPSLAPCPSTRPPLPHRPPISTQPALIPSHCLHRPPKINGEPYPCN